MGRRSSLVPAAALSLSLLASFPLRAVEVAPDVELLPGGFAPGAQPDGNTVVLAGRDGLIVVDTGRHAAHVQRILDFANAAGREVRFVVNTHWHLDHVGGNPVVRRAFPDLSVLASGAFDEEKSGFLRRYRQQLEELVARAESLEAAAPYRIDLAILADVDALGPDEVVAAGGRRALAGRDLELHLEARAVTGGDLWLVDPATKTVIAGDLVTLPVPFLDTACPEGWRAALGRVAAADWTTLVPGHGAPMDRAAFARYRAAFEGLLDCAASPRPKEECVDGWMSDVGELLPVGDEPRTRAMAGYYVEQVLRGPSDRLASLCGEP